MKDIRGLECELDLLGLASPLVGAGFEVPRPGHSREQRLELLGDCLGGGGGEGMGDVLQASLILPKEDRSKEHLGSAPH